MLMPDTLNKQTLINLLIDSPLREPIKINLIDIVNNTNDSDLPKVYSTITKELEIFQKATERRMKLADETIAKLSGTPAPTTEAVVPTSPVATEPVTPSAPTIPPLDLPPLPAPSVVTDEVGPQSPSLSVPPLDLPPMPTQTAAPAPAQPPVAPVAPAFQPLGTAPMTSTSDEDALAEIQKELDSLKTEAAADIATAAAPAPVATPATGTAPQT